METRTVMEVFDETVKKYPSRPAMKVKKNGVFTPISWQSYARDVRLAARALIGCGLEPKDGVSLIGYNCPQWLIADVGAVFAGGVPAGIYTTSSPEQCQYIAKHSDSSIAFVENEEHLEKFLAVRKDLPKLKKIIMMFGSSSESDVLSWDEFLRLGEKTPESDLEARISAQSPDDVCTLIYTSGTTGNPKAVMITHENITWTAGTALKLFEAGPEDRFISYLPLSHIAEQAISIYGPMVSGACTHFAESIEKLPDDLRLVHPTLFLGVPRVWEKIQAKIEEAGKGGSPIKKKIAAWARSIGLEGGYADQRREPRPLLYPLAEKIVFSKVRERLGLDACRLAVTAAAPISKSTLDFFVSLGIPIYEVYGMSECTGPATLSLPTAYKLGFVGRVMKGTELKIAEDGEICMRGRHVFKGYFKDEAATKETIDEEGWLHSGDIGEIDADGYVKITDRKKDLLITAGGENIAPQLIEGKLKAIPLVSQAVVVGDRKKHLSALLTLDPEKIADTAAEVGSSARTLKEAAECPKMHDFLMREVEGINRDLARVQTIKKIKVLPEELTIEGGELTPTMKVKRKVVHAKYENVIESFYA